MKHQYQDVLFIPKVNYTRFEWKLKLHSFRVKAQTTLVSSENSNYARFEWKLKLHSFRVKNQTTLVSSVGLPLVATVSDDHTWKLFNLPEGQLVLSGEGHKDWLSGLAFHPKGDLVATTSG